MAKDELIYVGAEATIKKTKLAGKEVIVKKRNRKSYRNKMLDENIIKKRIRSEVKILKKLEKIINASKVISFNEKESEIVLEFIDGKKLKDVIEKNKSLCELAGKEIRKIHDAGIIHGDLTTSNMIYYNKKIYFIDFGLGYFSDKIENKATDLVVFKKTFNATHSSLKNGFDLVLAGYSPGKELIERMKKIEERARYH